MATVPARAVICASWRHATPLWYARLVIAERYDVRVINVRQSRWFTMVADLWDRPILVTDEITDEKGYVTTPFRNLYRLERTEPPNPG